jgi:hypothetical protein
LFIDDHDNDKKTIRQGRFVSFRKIDSYLKKLASRTKNKSGEVSISAQIGSHTMRLTGVSERAFFSDPNLFINNHLMVSAYYDLDSPALYYDMYNIEAEALGQKLVWLPEMFPEMDGKNPLIKEPRDLDRLRPPNPRKDGRMPFIIEVYKRMVDLGLNPSPRYCAPFTLVGNIRGLSNLLMDILLDPPFVHRMFNFVTREVLLPWVDVLRDECGKDLFALGADAQASLPLTNLDIIEEYALGYVLKMRQQMEHIGVTAWWGERYLENPEDLFKLKLRGNPGVLKGYDPDVFEVGPERFAHFAAANDVHVTLGLDSTLLPSEPVQVIVERVKSYVSALRRRNGGGLFLNEVTRDCPSGAVHAAVQAARFFGRPHDGSAGLHMDDFVYKPRIPFSEWARV